MGERWSGGLFSPRAHEHCRRLRAHRHFSFTMWLAEMADFSESEAFELAKYDNATDDDPATEPSVFDISPGAVRRRSQYHFVSDARLAELRGAAEACTPRRVTASQFKQIGQYLHALEDRYSHEGYNDPRIGHASALHSPDKPWWRRGDAPPALPRMAHAKFDALVALRIRCLRDSPTQSESRAGFLRFQREIDAWSASESRLGPGGAGDRESPARWTALVRQLYGARYDVYTVRSVREYERWVAEQRKAGWGTQ